MDGMQTIMITNNIRRILFLGAVITLLTSCASTVHNIEANNYRTSCGGMLNDWGSCYSAAKAQCTKGYTEKDRREVKHPGEYNEMCLCMIYPVSRELVFSCR